MYAITCIFELLYFRDRFENFTQSWHQTSEFVPILSSNFLTFSFVGKLHHTSQFTIRVTYRPYHQIAHLCNFHGIVDFVNILIHFLPFIKVYYIILLYCKSCTTHVCWKLNQVFEFLILLVLRFISR